MASEWKRLQRRCIVTPRRCVVGCTALMSRASKVWEIGPSQRDRASHARRDRATQPASQALGVGTPAQGSPPLSPTLLLPHLTNAALILQRHLNRLSGRGDGNIGSLQDLQHASPPPDLAPASVATLYCMPGSKAFRQRTPEQSCSYDPQDPLYDQSRITGWTARECLPRQEWTQALPTLRRQFLYT
jgi:hypothetical protein